MLMRSTYRQSQCFLAIFVQIIVIFIFNFESFSTRSLINKNLRLNIRHYHDGLGWVGRKRNRHGLSHASKRLVGKWQFAIKRRCYRKGRPARFSVYMAAN